MRLSLFQYDIAWQDTQVNLAKIEGAILELIDTTDLVVLPEMATTGFSMSPEAHAQTMHGDTVVRLQALADKTNIAIIGSFMIQEDNQFFNRAILFSPKQPLQLYDKRHLFRMGAESNHYTAGTQPPLLFHYKTWTIRPLICYDLRFPVWSRNVDNQYDLIIYTANWPKARTKVWNTLLPARAIENMAYVCGVNRIGKDDQGIEHEGGSQVIDYKGNILASNHTDESIVTVELDRQALLDFRNNFPTWKDADQFELK